MNSNNNNTKTLSFDFYDNLKFFQVEFDTESIQRNRIMNIEYDGFHLDIPDLITMHHALYNKIYRQMREESENYWASVNEEITGIPTLDYQQKSTRNRITDVITKAALLFFLLIICIPVMCHAQDTIKASHAYLSKHVELSRKTNRIIRAWPHWVKVKSGKIVYMGNGIYMINGEEYHGPENEKQLVTKDFDGKIQKKTPDNF